VQVIQGSAVATMILNVVALWKQEPRHPRRFEAAPAVEPSFKESWARFCKGDRAPRRLLAIGLGTMAFGMADILLEPYGGQVLRLTVGTTTKLTAALALGSLIGFALASRVLTRGVDPLRLAGVGALFGVPAFVAVILAAPMDSTALFVFGTLLMGFGTGLFGHGTLTATMTLAPKEQVGLALGAWGAIQASAAGLAIAVSGVIRDVVTAVTSGSALPWGLSGPGGGYTVVYAIEILLLFATIVVIAPLMRRGTSPAAHVVVPGPVTNAIEQR